MASLVSLLDESARAYPDQTALCFRDREFTYREMRRRVDALAGALAGLGVGKGGFAAVVSANSNVTVEVLFACARLGAVCERYNVRLSPRVIAQLLARSEARVAFVSAALRPALAEALVGIGRTLMIVDVDGGAGAECGGVPRYEELLASADPVPSAIDIEGMRFSHDDILLCELPLFHVTFVSTLATLALGARLVIADSHKPADIAADIVRTGATRTALVPCLMRGLADYVAREGIELDTLELVTYGGEPVEPELLEHCRRLLPDTSAKQLNHCPSPEHCHKRIGNHDIFMIYCDIRCQGCGFLQGYGMTETTAAITMLLPEHHEHPRLLPTVGKAVPGMEIRIVDDEGRACAAGVPGEVLVRTDTLMLGYYRDPARTAEAVQDGWYRTGDIGFLDAEGFLTLVDRKNNLVISGGENVYPLEVSRCIKALAGVADAVVAGVPDKQWGESLAAFVVRAEGSRISEADIVAHCARELGGYKKPHAVRFVDDLGRSASGKVSREQLEELKGLL